MFDAWPMLEFPAENRSILDQFTRATSEATAHNILLEVVTKEGETVGTVCLESEEQLRWLMPVVNYSLSLPLTTDREFATIRRATQIYVYWLKALTEVPDTGIPAPLRETPEKYFRSIFDALRHVFTRREGGVDRQAALIEYILEATKSITATATPKYQDEVWARSLSFLLNSADLLFSPPIHADDISVRVGGSVIDTLLDQWLRAVLREQIPSPSYWRSLEVLTCRWRHHTTVVEAWARKLLGLTVLVTRRIYGQDYSTIPIDDESMRMFGRLPIRDDEESDMLFDSWLNIYQLMRCPAEILKHNPYRNEKINGTDSQKSSFTMEDLASAQPLCFFLAVTAIQRMVDVFYGDNRVPIDMRECARRHFIEKQQKNGNIDSHALSTEGRSSFSSNVSATQSHSTHSQSATQSRSNSDLKKHRTSRLSEKNLSVRDGPPSESLRRGTSLSSESAPVIPLRSSPSYQVALSLAANPGYPAFIGEKSPKTDKLLNLTMGFLLEAASARLTPPEHIGDDVISSLSVCSADTSEDTRGENTTVASSGEKAEHRRSYAGSASSSSGIAELHGVDGVEAGRAAAIGSLVRMVCSKGSAERLRPDNLEKFLAVVYEALIYKDRLVLCSLFYYGHTLYRLALPGVEALLPHFVYAADIVLTESLTLRLHPSFDETEMRRVCLRALLSVVSWPTTFGLSKIPQLTEGSNLRSAAQSYLQLRALFVNVLTKTTLRKETDSHNLQLALAMCTILCEEAATFDLALTEEEKREATRLAGQYNGAGTPHPEKMWCTSIVRGVVCAVCDRLTHPVWSSDFSVCLAALNVLNGLSSIDPSILFTSKEDMSTGSLIVSSLCRFIETQLMKPPPMHSKDLHSSVVAAYQSLVVWLTAAPMLAECESVLCTVADTIQLGITGAKKQEDGGEKKAASGRVFDAAECVLYSLFTLVCRAPRSSIMDERRLLYLFGPSLIDTTKFSHFLVNGDSILSIHEASHIPALAKGAPCVVYVRRSPMHPATVGFARLLADPEGSATNGESKASTPANASPADKKPTSSPSPSTSTSQALAAKFQLPPDFNKVTCKLDATYKPLEWTKETEEINQQLEKAIANSHISTSAWSKLPEKDRECRPKEPVKTCNSLRVFLYDMGLFDRSTFGRDLIPLDSGQSLEFFRDLHDQVDSCPSSAIHTAYIFYVREGQRAALDILDNGMSIQSTSAEFCTWLSELGEGVEVGVHEGWTGHWSTAYSNERKPQEEREGVDHYILDGISHILYRAEGGCELAFVMPTQRAIKHFGQEMPNPKSSRRSATISSKQSVSSTSELNTAFRDENDDVFAPPTPVRTKSMEGVQPYSGGGSSMGNAPAPRRSSDLRVAIVWLERLEDMTHFPLDELLCSSEDGGDRQYSTSSSPSVSSPPPRPAHLVLFLYQIEPGLILVRTKSTTARFGEPGPLVDGVVVSLSNLSTFVRLTLLNVVRRSVAEVENYQLTHVKRRQAIIDFAKKYSLPVSYDDFLIRLLSQK